MAMLRSAPVWAVWFAALGNCFGLQLLLRYTPTYLHKILGYDVVLTGYASAVSQIGAFFIKIFAGIASDRIKFCTETNKVRFFNTISIGGMGICYLILAILPNSEKSKI
jgi:MFS family permease